MAVKTFRALAASLLLLATAVYGLGAQQAAVPPAVKAAAERITEAQIKKDLEFLASDELKGRNTPSPGFDAAADYIERRLRRAGVKPAGDNGTYRQSYVMRETTLAAGEATLSIGERAFTLGEGFALRSFAGELMTAGTRAVYVGHGWTADGVDPYRGVDVRGKIVVVHAQSARPKGAAIKQLGRVTIGGTPPLVEAHNRGAAAVLFLHSSEPQRGGAQGSARAMVRRELDPAVPSAYAAPPLTSIQLGEEATRALLEGTPLNSSRLAEQTKSQEYPASFELPAPVSIRLPAKTAVHRPFNLVALVEGTDPKLKQEHIVVQSHLDGAVGSRAIDGDGVYNSADDNATGSAANIAIAERMMAVRPRRSVIFVWDSGEEQGLWGTRQFVAHPPAPLANIAAMINIDMIGANRAPGSPDAKDERVTGPHEVFLIGPGALSQSAGALVERVNASYLKLALNRKYDTPESEFFYPRTDAGPFLERGVLTIGFTTGLHDRYHLPADEARFLDTQKVTAIAKTVFAVAHALASADERPRIEQPIPPTVLRVAGAQPPPSAAAPRPIEGDYVLRNFRFTSGETLPELRMHYRTFGTPRKDAQGIVRNAVLIMHGTGGTGGQFTGRGFAGELFGPGQPLDASKFYIILPDDIGHGRSSKPSDALRAKFPRYGYIDMVEAEHRLVTEGLGVNHLRLVMGTSMGGMHTWMWASRYPDFMDALMPLASLPAQIAGRNRVWRRVVIDAIRNDPEWKNGDYKTQPQSLRTVAQMLWLVGSNPILRQKAAPTLADADRVLDDYVANYLKTGDANDILYALEASRDYDPGPGLEKIKAPLLAVNSADDLINPPELQILEREIARVAKGRAIVLPLTDRTTGHGTHTQAALWKHLLVELLRETDR